jgi:glycerate dehydrogenase
MQIVIPDAYAADQGDAGYWAELQVHGALAVFSRTAAAEMVRRCGQAEALVVNKARVDATLLRQLPRLRYIGITATGTNIVDLDAAAARGVAVTNVPGYAAAAVAQLTFALLLELRCGTSALGRAAKDGRWARSPDFCLMVHPLTELAGKTLVLFGGGAIGTAVGRIAEAFGMDVLRAQVPGRSTSGRVEPSAALAVADVVSLHCPLTPETERLVDARFLARLKPGAILLNTSRGGLIDDKALVEALASGHLGGAGLDVLSQEPPPLDHPLLTPSAPWAERVLVTPHIAWGTVEARRRLCREAALNLAAFLRGERRNRVV